MTEVRVEVLIPAYNESERIGATVRAVLPVAGISRVLVVDDGSADRTADVASEAGAEVLRLTANVGKGGALEAGADLLGDGRVVLLLDADLGETAAQAAALLAPVLNGEAEMSVAAFPRPLTKAGLGLVKGLARWGIRRLGSSSFHASAPLSGQRAMTRECMEMVRPFATGYGAEVAITIRALRKGARVVEVETTMQHNATGRDAAGFAHRGRQFLHVAVALVRLARERGR